MSDLLKINVNDHVEKKNGLTYLSWAWAWSEVLKIDHAAEWFPVHFGHDENRVPYLQLPDGSMMVGIQVKIKDQTRMCLLPVMNHRNQAIKNPDAFAVNTAMMRCLAKAIAMHGLGLYIYAGEDLPEGDEKKKGIDKDNGSPSALMFAQLQPEVQDFLRKAAPSIDEAMPDAAKAYELIEMTLDNWTDEEREEVKGGLWHLLDSKTRSAVKRHLKENA